MPYLTPEVLPEGDYCRPLFIPANSDWLAIVSGALTELVKPYNWERQGSVTVAEAVARMQLMIDQYYEVLCTDICELPEGGSIIRIGLHGELEQLIDGEWGEPTGDYIIPPPAAREGGTEEDQICLAAKNAVSALHELYSSLSDSFASTLSTIEAFDAMVGVATIYFGFEFAPITYGIYAFLSAIFQGVYLALSYLTADLWTDDFSRQIECFLVACASNDAGVVTFDWDCFGEKLNSLANDFELSELQIRLYLQVGYLLQFIGGAAGLNLAGATMEITEGECDCACEPEMAILTPGYGELEYLGDGRWLGTALLVSGAYRLSIGLVTNPDGCWRYFDHVLTGTYTYAETRTCGICTDVTFSLAGDGTNVCAIYLANEAPTPFSFEFTAVCEG